MKRLHNPLNIKYIVKVGKEKTNETVKLKFDIKNNNLIPPANKQRAID